MTGEEAIRIVRASGVSQAEFARLIGMSAMGVQKWASGGKPSGPAAVILRLVRDRPDFIETLRKIQEGRGDRAGTSACDNLPHINSIDTP